MYWVPWLSLKIRAANNFVNEVWHFVSLCAALHAELCGCLCAHREQFHNLQQNCAQTPSSPQFFAFPGNLANAVWSLHQKKLTSLSWGLVQRLARWKWLSALLWLVPLMSLPDYYLLHRPVPRRTAVKEEIRIIHTLLLEILRGFCITFSTRCERNKVETANRFLNLCRNFRSVVRPSVRWLDRA